MSFKICKQRTPTSPPNKYKFDFSATNMFLFCYIIIGIFLIGFSPIIFLLCNIIILCGLIYSKKVDLWKLVILNIFFLIIWFLFFGSYVYLLTHEPSIPFYTGDIIVLDPVNMILIVHYCLQFPSIFRPAFLDTIFLLHLISNVLGWYPPLFFYL